MARRSDPPGMQEVKGNPGKRGKKRTAEERARILEAAPATDRSVIAPPEFLNDEKLDEAIAIWREIAPELQRLNMLHVLDRYTLSMYCVHMADWIRNTRAIAIEGSYKDVPNVNGEMMPRLNPAVKAREIAERHILEIGSRFSLDPFHRFKLMRDQAALPLGDLFNRRDDRPDKPDDGAQNPVGLMQRLAAPPRTRPN